jgi:predicted ATPase
MITKGYASPEVESTYARAEELARGIGDPEQLFPVLVGLFYYRGLGYELSAAKEIAHQIMDLVQSDLDSHRYLPAAHQLMASVHAWTGEFVEAVEEADRGTALYDPEVHAHLVQIVPQDPGEACDIFAGYTLFMLGHLDQAWTRMDRALEWARELNHGNSILEALSIGGFMAAESGWTERALEYGAELHRLAKDWGIPDRVWVASVLLGAAKVSLGEIQEAIQQLTEDPPFALLGVIIGSWKSMAYLAAGDYREALRMAEQGLHLVTTTGERQYWSQNLCRKGEALAAAALAGDTSVGPDAEARAEASFRKAIQVARDQQAKFLELQVAMRLARFWRDQGKRAEARQLLGDVYGWFTEGLHFPDLVAAKELLDELA